MLLHGLIFGAWLGGGALPPPAADSAVERTEWVTILPYAGWGMRRMGPGGTGWDVEFVVDGIATRIPKKDARHRYYRYLDFRYQPVWVPVDLYFPRARLRFRRVRQGPLPHLRGVRGHWAAGVDAGIERVLFSYAILRDTLNGGPPSPFPPADSVWRRRWTWDAALGQWVGVTIPVGARTSVVVEAGFRWIAYTSVLHRWPFWWDPEVRLSWAWRPTRRLRTAQRSPQPNNP